MLLNWLPNQARLSEQVERRLVHEAASVGVGVDHPDTKTQIPPAQEAGKGKQIFSRREFAHRENKQLPDPQLPGQSFGPNPARCARAMHLPLDGQAGPMQTKGKLTFSKGLLLTFFLPPPQPIAALSGRFDRVALLSRTGAMSKHPNLAVTRQDSAKHSPKNIAQQTFWLSIKHHL